MQTETTTGQDHPLAIPSTIVRTNYWLIWPGKLTRQQVMNRYVELLGRDPDRIYSPEESQTLWWWTGWLDKDEYMRLRRKPDEREPQNVPD